MKLYYFMLVLASIPMLISCASQKVARDPQMVKLEQEVIKIQTESNIPGMQILVSEGLNPTFQLVNGKRAIEQEAIVTTNDQWHLGSCTKPMTAFLIGKLVDEGKIRWTTKLKEIVPADFKLAKDVGSITIEQLLSHSAGLIDVTLVDKGRLWPTLFTYNIKADELRDKLVKSLLRSPLSFKPGTKSEYSNSGYVVLGWVIEKLKHDTWENLMSKELFTPLGMKSCGFGPAGEAFEKNASQPWAHSIENGILKSIAPGPQADNPRAIGPAGTVHCAVKDWHKFLNLFNRGEMTRARFVTLKTYDKLLSLADKGPFTYSTIGRVDRPWAKGDAFVMAGSNTYNYALMILAPELNRIYTVNANAGHSEAAQGTSKILKLLIESSY